MVYLYLILGIFILVIGGELLVKSAIGLNNKFKLSPLLIGTTVVSFGTSAPELIVSLQAMLNGNPGVTIGNVAGSNIANLGLVLGCVILLKPFQVNKRKYGLSYFIMFVSAALFFVFSSDGKISIHEGVFLLFGLVVFLVLSIRFMKIMYKNDRSLIKEDLPSNLKSKLDLKFIILYFFVGAAGLAWGSELLVSNAVILASRFGVSEFIIGVTVVALGTSLPELITSLVAIIKGEDSISLGNLIGSNIFNVFAVLGCSSMVSSIKVSSNVIYFDLFIMLAFVIMTGALIFLTKKLMRIHGFLFLLSYLTYIIYSVF
tara:strand:- start:351 stop:1298 length:948 start_codon:yes stop_codon:yes gene_type:complete